MKFKQYNWKTYNWKTYSQGVHLTNIHAKHTGYFETRCMICYTIFEVKDDKYLFGYNKPKSKCAICSGTKIAPIPLTEIYAA